MVSKFFAGIISLETQKDIIFPSKEEEEEDDDEIKAIK
jgi:hypothetical protein